MLVDANLLLFAADERSHFHATARSWLAAQLTGARRVGLPWQSLSAFFRISTSTRASDDPLAPEVAWGQVIEWLRPNVAWIPAAGRRHAQILGGLVTRYQVRADLMTDAQLAALAIEHGLTVCSADTDFARFTEVRWENPLAG